MGGAAARFSNPWKILLIALLPVPCGAVHGVVLTNMEVQLIVPDKAAGDRSGQSVCMAGDVALVGAPAASPGGIYQAGAAYVWQRSASDTNAWIAVAKLTASDKAANDMFGGSVYVAGDVAVVGAHAADPGGVDKAGAVYVFERNAGGTNAWGQVAKVSASDKAADDEFGVSVSVAADVLLVGAYMNAADGTNRTGAAYVFERNAGGTNAWGQVAKLRASDGASSDNFGISVSVAGDVALIGAYFSDPGGASDAGAAYVFERNAGGTNAWGQVAKLTASDKVAFDNFGISVSVAGDVALVGSIYSDPGGIASAGAAYVFERNAGGTNAWGQVAKLSASDKAAYDYFGNSVSVAGDMALISAPFADPGGVSAAGAAYVFGRNAGGTNAWGQVAKLTATNKALNDYFGFAVSAGGNVLLAGAPYADPGGSNAAGVVYAYTARSDDWRDVRHLTVSDGAASDYFGVSVGVRGETAVVGAFWTPVASKIGAAYVYDRNAGGTNAWGQVRKLLASDGAAGDLFGISSAVDGDTILIGADGDDASAGSAYVFQRNLGGTNNWGQLVKLTASDRAAGDKYGCTADLAGDVIVVAASDKATSQGAAYVHERNAGGTNAWGLVRKLTASDGAANDKFGQSICVHGDVVVVGASQKTVGGNANQGAAYVFERNAGGTNNWGQVAKLVASDGAANDRLGVSVAAAGDVVVVGAYTKNGGQGAAYVFQRNAGGTNNWGEVRKLTASDGAAGDNYGYWVAVAGDVIAVGSIYDTVTVNQQGSIYVYGRNHGGTNSWGEVKHLIASDAAAKDYLGRSVAMGGDILLGGAYGKNSSRGQVYVYEGVYTMPPGAPLVLAATNVTATNFWANWNAGGGDAPTNYYLDVTNDAGFVAGYSSRSVGAARTCNVTGLTAGVTYYYLVRAENLAGVSSNSAVTNVTTSGSAMVVLGTNGAVVGSGEAVSTAKGTDFGGIPWGQALTNRLAITNAGTVTLTITGWTTNGSGAGSFSILDLPSSVSAGGVSNFRALFYPSSPLVHTCTVSIANSSTNTPYKVNLAGTGLKQDQAITFPPVADQLTTNRVGLAAAASSGLPVSFAIQGGPALITGGTNLTFQGAGAVILVAGQSGDALWNPAPDVARTMQVTKVAAEVVLGSLAQTFDGSPRTATATTMPAGLTVAITYDGSTASPTNAGSYAVTGVVDDVMYEGSAAGTLVVDRASAGVYLQGLTQVYSGGPKYATVTTMPAGLTFTVTYDGGAASPTNVGTYAVTGTVTELNYRGWTSGVLTILQGSQAIMFPPIVDPVVTGQVGLSATAESGLPVSFSVASGAASIADGTNLSFASAGMVSVAAHQPGDANWEPAASVTNSFRVWDSFALAVASAHGSCTPTVGAHMIVEGDTLTNSATTPVPDGSTTQFVCAGWTMEGHDPGTGTTNWFVMTVTNDATLTWLWSTNYWLDTEPGPHGTVTAGDGWQAAGVTTSLLAVADEYYHFTQWTGDASGEANPANLLMDGPKMVAASFAEDLAARGTPHWWLAGYGLTNSGASFDEAETNDVDGDGFTANEEWIADTVPTQFVSHLRLIRADSANSIAVTFSCTNSRLYSLMYEDLLPFPQEWIGVITQMNVRGEADGEMALVDSAHPYWRFYRVAASITNLPPPGMVLIPAGRFMMGNATNVFPVGEGFADEVPQHAVYVSGFHMDRFETTRELWYEVWDWALTNGYSLTGGGSGKDVGHPIHTVSWHDVVKWCNARSEKDGLAPCYTTNGFVYRSGTNDEVECNWSANGYRLPTEAEWEKAARGGVADTRFPWSDYTNRISHAKANYNGNSGAYGYDLSGGYNPVGMVGGWPYTSPAGSFAPNGYGLYDMAGNVVEWCWDWYSSSYYSISPDTDPNGPASGSVRVIRNQSWGGWADGARCAFRWGGHDPASSNNGIGFRCVRRL